MPVGTPLQITVDKAGRIILTPEAKFNLSFWKRLACGLTVRIYPLTVSLTWMKFGQAGV
jgi:hypothetical protein